MYSQPITYRMKQFIILVLICSLFACEKKQKKELKHTTKSGLADIKINFNISKDTFDFPVYGDLVEAVLFRDRYYCMFESRGDNATYTFKKMVVFSKNGRFIEDVFIPKGIQEMIYYVLVVENDSLFLQRTQFEEETFVLGKYVADFEPIKTRKLKVFEDKDFNIYTFCFGEWGGTLLFEDKKSKILYEGLINCDASNEVNINSLNGEYYIRSKTIFEINIVKIKDPKKLKKTKWSIVKKRFGGSKHAENMQTLINTDDGYVFNSFVKNGRLLHIYLKNRETFIGEIVDQKLKPYLKFDFPFYTHLSQQLPSGKQILTFEHIKSDLGGILIIDKNSLRFIFSK